MRITKLFLFFLIATLLGCNKEPINNIPEPGDIDDFFGKNINLILTNEIKNFKEESFTCYVKTADGTIITRKANHTRLLNKSHIKFEHGIKEGTYRLLYLEYDNPDKNEEIATLRLGIGHVIEAKNDTLYVKSSFNSQLGFISDSPIGKGTEKNPYIICSDDHLAKLKDIVNDPLRRKQITDSTYFKQICNIDMKTMSQKCSRSYGWDPIGNSFNTPFIGNYNGDGHKITNLYINRIASQGIGLFGYIYGSTLKNIKIHGANIKGEIAVGGIAGGVITDGTYRAGAMIHKCTVYESSIASADLNYGVSIGGILGLVDVHAAVVIDSCRVFGQSTEIAGGYCVGGIVGSASTYSTLMVSNCINEAKAVRGGIKCIGGIVGTADTLNVFSCLNKSAVSGGIAAGTDPSIVSVGVGGLVGGAGYSNIVASANEGSVSGKRGVGGIIGSTLVSGSGSESDPFVYNTAVVVTSKNTGAISGSKYVGGICGEAQLGAYGSFNKGSVKGSDTESFVGGISGGGSITVLNNCHNFGAIEGVSHCGGVSGAVIMGSLANLSNYGTVSTTSGHTAGIVGRVGSYTMMNYCGNYGSITSKGGGYVGGIAGEIGDPREWSKREIASCVFAAVETAVLLAGGGIALWEAKLVTGTTKKVLKIAGTSINVAFTLIDMVLGVEGTIGTLIYLNSPIIMEEVILGVKSNTEKNYNLITTELDAELSKSTNSLTNILPQGLALTGITQDYYQSRKSVSNFFSQSDDNQNTFNMNINNKRDARYTHIEKDLKSAELAHSIVTGITMGAAVLLLITGDALTLGMGTGAVVAIGATFALVGGANAITNNVDNFEENVAVVSQCVNYGSINSQDSKSGGIVGCTRQYVKISDCLNVGKSISGTVVKTGGISGVIEEKSEVVNSLNIGDRWYYPLYSASGIPDFMYTSKNNKYLNNSYEGSSSDGTKITTMQLMNAQTFQEWNMQNNLLWKMASQYPVPAQSEMQKPL